MSAKTIKFPIRRPNAISRLKEAPGTPKATAYDDFSPSDEALYQVLKAEIMRRLTRAERLH